MSELVVNGHVIGAADGAIGRWKGAKAGFPEKMKELIRTEQWKDFINIIGQRVQFSSFRDFIQAPVCEGLETRLEVVLALCEDDPEAQKMVQAEWDREGDS
jgi:hypothetical protein